MLEAFFAFLIKGIVQSKMQFLSLGYLLTHMLSQTCIIFSFCWIQKKIFWGMWVTKQLLVHTEKILWKSLRASNCLFTHIVQNNRRKKLILVWNNLRLSKWWYKNKTLWQNLQTDDRTSILGWTILSMLMKQQIREKSLTTHDWLTLIQLL